MAGKGAADILEKNTLFDAGGGNHTFFELLADGQNKLSGLGLEFLELGGFLGFACHVELEVEAGGTWDEVEIGFHLRDLFRFVVMFGKGIDEVKAKLFQNGGDLGVKRRGVLADE